MWQADDSTRPVLFLLGDSISLGYGPYLERMLAGRFACDRKGSELLEGVGQGWPAPGIIQRLAALDSDQPALNGGDSACVLDYLQERAAYLRDQQPVLLLNCGLHDLRVDPQTGAHQVELEAYAANLEEISRLVPSVSQRAVWVRTTPVADARHQRLSSGFQRFNADVEAYNAIGDTVMKGAGIPGIDLYNFTCGLSEPTGDLESLYIDHVHFTEPMRRLQGGFIAGWLEALAYA